MRTWLFFSANNDRRLRWTHNEEGETKASARFEQEAVRAGNDGLGCRRKDIACWEKAAHTEKRAREQAEARSKKIEVVLNRERSERRSTGGAGTEILKVSVLRAKKVGGRLTAGNTLRVASIRLRRAEVDGAGREGMGLSRWWLSCGRVHQNDCAAGMTQRTRILSLLPGV
ncbi:hypothetical protein ERJ75_001701000 [Trypanosoma vivax]|nr:hypothetical protein ERJ75_001701000 [Trypanosoma vivax]